MGLEAMRSHGFNGDGRDFYTFTYATVLRLGAGPVGMYAHRTLTTRLCVYTDRAGTMMHMSASSS
jgi:hypothetical protein